MINDSVTKSDMEDTYLSVPFLDNPNRGGVVASSRCGWCL
jgi:hypothetical protein